MKKGLYTTSVILILIIDLLNAQPLTQVIRGRIMDRDNKISLPGANVAIYKDSVMVKGGVTDNDGFYRIEKVPLGRYTLIASYLGYQSKRFSDINVNSAKEIILNIELEESIVNMEEVNIKARSRFESVNEMATLSARTFNVDETDRYAGSRGDPARMASNYAGVQGTDDSSNDIIVRGNSPMGILWRLEGVNIPNPNHFGVPGYTGGPVTILNNKFLANSEFISGAFPAEYGNAIAAVFDLKMKNGNNEKHEYSLQWGFLGTEIFSEGPLTKKKGTHRSCEYPE